MSETYTEFYEEFIVPAKFGIMFSEYCNVLEHIVNGTESPERLNHLIPIIKETIPTMNVMDFQMVGFDFQLKVNNKNTSTYKLIIMSPDDGYGNFLNFVGITQYCLQQMNLDITLGITASIHSSKHFAGAYDAIGVGVNRKNVYSLSMSQWVQDRMRDGIVND